VTLGSFEDASWNICRGPYETDGPPDKPKASAEGTDFPCYPAGDTHGPLDSAPDLVTGCLGGDLDYDGTPYLTDWPDSVTPDLYPSALTVGQPTTGNGTRYPQIEFLTDNPATNSLCTATSLGDCTVPPPQSPGGFYPYWTEARSTARARGSSARCRTETRSAATRSTARSRRR
jgi:hypothetical protein